MQFWFSIYAMQHVFFFLEQAKGFAFEVNIDV